MITNLHTHTPRCRHARGSEEEYVSRALERGLKTLGFSDHTPYWFPGTYYSRFRMYPEQLPEYIQTVDDMRRRYADRIQIRLGLEAEYYPAFFPELVSRLRDTQIEYLILGQHYIGDEIGDHYSGWETTDETLIRRYCHQVADAMHTGLFTYLAHPDLIHYTGNPNIYRKHVRTICRAAKDCAVPLEINFLGMLSGRHYPNERFWEVAAEENCTVIFGCDAHAPEELTSLKEEQTGLELVRRFGLKLVEDTPLRSLGSSRP